MRSRPQPDAKAAAAKRVYTETRLHYDAFVCIEDTRAVDGALEVRLAAYS